MEAKPQLVSCDALPARLANYWYHAHDPARALPTALDAARAARRRNAFAEQLGMLERALELWDMVSEEVRAHTLRPYDWAETYPPGSCDHSTADGDCDRIQLVDVLAEAVVAARRCGDRERGLSLARRGLRLVDEAVHPVRAAWFRINRARMLGNLRRSGDDEEILHAHRLVDHLPPSAVQAEVFALGAGVAMLKKPGPEHIELAERAIRIAQEVGAHSVEVHARMTLGGLRYDVHGDADGGLAELAGAVEAARRLGVPDLLLRGVNNLASMQRGVGRAEEAVVLAREGLVYADGNGLLRNIGTILTGNLAEALTDLGRIREAAEVLDACELTSLTGTHAEFLDRMRGDLALLRGDLAGAATMLAQARSANRVGQLQHSVPISRLAVRIAALAGRPMEAREELLAALAEEGRLGHESDVYPLLVEAATVEADSRGLPEARRAGPRRWPRSPRGRPGCGRGRRCTTAGPGCWRANWPAPRPPTPRSSGPPRSPRCARPGCRTRWRSPCCGRRGRGAGRAARGRGRTAARGAGTGHRPGRPSAAGGGRGPGRPGRADADPGGGRAPGRRAGRDPARRGVLRPHPP